MFFKEEFERKVLIKILLERNLVTKEQVADAEQMAQKLRLEGRKYLGQILVEKGYVTQSVIDNFIHSMQDNYDKFCVSLLNKGYIRKSHYKKIMDEKKENPTKDIAKIVIENGFLGRDTFYKLFNNYLKVPFMGQLLISKNIITKEQFEDARKTQQMKSFQDILCEKKYLTKKDLESIKEELVLKKERWYLEQKRLMMSMGKFD
jgi:hypothetical protein